MVAEQGSSLSDVVFVIEGTASLSPYVESLKTNYIVPALEYFNGGPADDRDCGCDYNSTLYALVVFLAADCAPEPSATCSTPTTNIQTFLSLLDKVPFSGGSAESHSNIAEGLSTALQAFDDFQHLRDSNTVVQKHCILICNSPAYNMPALESSAYPYLPLQIASHLAERQINFSILSPRKNPNLLKLYEKAGGDLQVALSKNYAKDRRHLVLLKGFQLQERPMSPPSMENKNIGISSASVNSPPTQGQKRPNTNSPPSSRDMTSFKQPQNNYAKVEWPAENSAQISVQSSVPGSGGPTATLTYAQPSLPGQPPRPTIPTSPATHLASLNQPNPPNVTITSKAETLQLTSQYLDNVRPQRGHSPVNVGGPRMSWNQPAVPSPPASTPPTTSVLATQLSMAPSNIRHPNSQLSQPVSLQNLSQSQTISIPPSQIYSQSGTSLRPNLPNVGLRMTAASPGSITSVSTTSGALPGQLGQKHPSFVPPNSQPSQQQTSQIPSQGMPSNMQSKLGSGSTLMSSMIPSQVPSITSASSSNIPTQSMQSNIGSLSTNSTLSGQQPSAQNNSSLSTALKDRRHIWSGIIEFQDKTQNPPQQTPRLTHSLSCTFSCTVNNGEPEVNAEKWPNKLVLQLLPKQLVMTANLFAVLKTSARHVLIHFSQESEALQKLCKTMSSNFVGCIQFSPPCDIRIMIVIYMPDKRIYMGFIAHDQDNFFNSVRQMYDNHRKQLQQQQQKQRLQLSGNPNAAASEGGIGLPSSTASNPGIIMPQQPTIANIAGNNEMGPRIPLGQQQITQNVPQLQQQVSAPSSGVVHSTTMSQSQQPLNQPQTTNASRFTQLEAARQQNLLKIQQLQQTLEAAQQKEVQYKMAQEQQQQQQHQQQQQQQQQQVVIRQLQQQIQQQQQQLQHHQQRIQMQQVQQANQGGHNPQLRNLLQQQVQQQIRQQQHQMLMQQHPQNIRAQLTTSMPSGGMNSSVGQPPPSQQQSQQSQQSWGDAGILDLLPP